jgi:hypothetical protein
METWPQGNLAGSMETWPQGKLAGSMETWPQSRGSALAALLCRLCGQVSRGSALPPEPGPARHTQQAGQAVGVLPH